MKKDTQIILVGIAGLAAIIINDIIGLNNPPSNILWTPIVLTVIIWGVNYPLYKADFRIAIIYNYFLLLFNDILLRGFPTGVPVDEEGKGWIFLFSMLAFIIATIVMTGYAYVYRNDIDKKTKRNNFLSILISAFVTFLIYVLFLLDF